MSYFDVHSFIYFKKEEEEEELYIYGIQFEFVADLTIYTCVFMINDVAMLLLLFNYTVI